MHRTGAPPGPRVLPLDLDRPEVLAEVLRLQRASYAVEAALIGDDRIPPLHEGAAQLHAAGLRWLGVRSGGVLAGALAWEWEDDALDVHRLVVDPTQLRRGTGRRLVQHLLGAHPEARALVSTGRDNAPARRLYESLGFAQTGQAEVLPGLWVVHYARAGSATSSTSCP